MSVSWSRSLDTCEPPASTGYRLTPAELDPICRGRCDALHRGEIAERFGISVLELEEQMGEGRG